MKMNGAFSGVYILTERRLHLRDGFFLFKHTIRAIDQLVSDPRLQQQTPNLAIVVEERAAKLNLNFNDRRIRWTSYK